MQRLSSPVLIVRRAVGIAAFAMLCGASALFGATATEIMPAAAPTGARVLVVVQDWRAPTRHSDCV